MATELEKLQRAKLYLENLSLGIHPISGQALPEDAVLNNQRLARCFAYTAEILDQVIYNGGFVGRPPKKEALLPFEISRERLQTMEYSQEPIGIRRFAEKVNQLIDDTVMQKIKITHMTKWLVDQGYLLEETGENGQKRKIPSEKGLAAGISAEWHEGQDRSYMMVLYNKEAQVLLAERLMEMIPKIEGWKGA